MTPAEFRTEREGLGISPNALADLLGISRSTIKSWESGKSNISPEGIALLRDLVAEADRFVVGLAQRFALEDDSPVLRTYATDEDFAEAFPELSYPAAWHRKIAARVREQIPRLRIIY